MLRRLVIVTVSVFSIIAPASHANSAHSNKSPKSDVKAPQFYAIKGVQLGVSLEDFKKSSSPDSQSATPSCTDDGSNEVYIPLDDTEKRLGIVKCVWIDATGEMASTSIAMGIKLASSNFVSRNYSFDFIRDPRDGVMRFYKLICLADDGAEPDVINSLKAKYGSPHVETDTVQNGDGGVFKQYISIWLNRLSSITVIDPYTSVDKMGIFFTDERLNDIYENELRTDKEKIGL